MDLANPKNNSLFAHEVVALVLTYSHKLALRITKHINRIGLGMKGCEFLSHENTGQDYLWSKEEILSWIKQNLK